MLLLFIIIIISETAMVEHEMLANYFSPCRHSMAGLHAFLVYLHCSCWLVTA